MNENSGSPATKKIRLIQESRPIPNAGKVSKRTENDLVSIKVFEWKEEKVKLLIFGVVRDNISIGIPDISSIIYYYLLNMLLNYHINNNKHSNIKYMNNNNIICNFKTIGFGWSTIIFSPFYQQY